MSSGFATFYRCKLCGREFGSLNAWHDHVVREHFESEAVLYKVLGLGDRPQLWQVLRAAERGELVEQFAAAACCGRCEHYNFMELKCRKRPQIVVLTPVNTAVCPDFKWAEVPAAAAVEMIRLDRLDGVQRGRKRRERAPRERPRVAVAWWGDADE